jgi:hypothetical protein
MLLRSERVEVEPLLVVVVVVDVPPTAVASRNFSAVLTELLFASSKC